MYDSVLMPVNLSNEASWTAALPAARALVAPGGTLHVLTVVPDLGHGMTSGYFPPDYEQKAMHDAGQTLDRLAGEWESSGLTARAHVVHGKVAQEILKAATKVGAGAIVMGSHRPEMADYLMGANALRVVQRATQSVFVVRA